MQNALQTEGTETNAIAKATGHFIEVEYRGAIIPAHVLKIVADDCEKQPLL